MFNFKMTAFAVLLLAMPALADDASDRAKLLGSWQWKDDAGKEVTVWVLEVKGAALHIMQSHGDQKVSEFECPPKGGECEGTVKGQKANVTMYYDGPALVQFETLGTDVTRRRFHVAAQPDTLEIEVMPIVGGDKAETLHLTRISAASH
jgi:hypothetical protein